jgi:hypothetical protein
MNKQAEQAIDRSVSHNEIVHIAATEEIDAALTEVCESSVETQNGSGLPTTEFWGTREDGEEWRVHTTTDF